MNYQFKILENENWWGGTAAGGPDQPYTQKSNVRYDFTRHCSNQTMPLLVSSEGRYIWSEDPYVSEFKDGWITTESGQEVLLVQAGSTLRDAVELAEYLRDIGHQPESAFPALDGPDGQDDLQ